MEQRSVKIVREVKQSYKEQVLNTPSAVAHLLMSPPINLHLNTEEVVILLTLNAKNKVIAWDELSRGNLNSAFVHPREVFKRAILDNAFQIVIAHNHPSGNVCINEADSEVTKRIVDAGEVIGIPLIDHIIVGDSWISFRNEGLMPKSKIEFYHVGGE